MTQLLFLLALFLSVGWWLSALYWLWRLDSEWDEEDGVKIMLCIVMGPFTGKFLGRSK